MTKQPPRAVWIILDKNGWLSEVHPTRKEAEVGSFADETIHRYILPPKPKKVKP